MPNGPQVHDSIMHVSLAQTLSIYYMVFLLLFHMGGQFWASKSDNKCENKKKILPETYACCSVLSTTCKDNSQMAGP